MSSQVKRANLYNRQAASIQKSGKVNASGDVQATSHKDEVHFLPDERSGNEQRLLEHFYAKTHNLMASYQRLDDSNQRHQFYKTHKAEALSGGQELVLAINTLLDDASAYDQQYGTFYNFLMMSILHDYERPLKQIGINLTKYERLTLDSNVFYLALIDAPEDFEFLFVQRTGLVERLDQIYIKINPPLNKLESAGQILDLKG